MDIDLDKDCLIVCTNKEDSNDTYYFSEMAEKPKIKVTKDLNDALVIKKDVADGLIEILNKDTTTIFTYSTIKAIDAYLASRREAN